jgi:hypothetical protein
LIAQRQQNREIHPLRLRQRTYQRCFSVGNRRAEMMLQYLERLLRLIGSGEKGKRRKDKKTSKDSGFHG